jgi:hypothetical protein
LAAVAFLPGVLLGDATGARRLATRVFVAAVAGAVLVCSFGIEVVIYVSLLSAAVCRVMTVVTPFRPISKSNLENLLE